MPMGTQADEDQDDENMDRELRKNRITISLALGRRKKRKSDALDPYRKFVAFYTRSENPFVNYYAVLDAGMAWETSQFGDLSRDQFRANNVKLLDVYRRLRSAVPQFTQDFYELRQAPEELEALQKQLNDVVTSARGADIHSLREKGLSYIELEQPDKQLIPRIDPAAPKTSFRGHNHPILSRILCPVKYLADFDAHPSEFREKLLNNKVRVVAGDFPALLYPHGEYDPDDLESGLFRNVILLRFYKHIFTAPSSARQELTAGSRPKIKRPQAMLNNMNAVTPGSIAYAAIMFRHCVSSLDDWRTEDDLFKREEFFNNMVVLLEDLEDEWVKDTLKWWNLHVFGTPFGTSDDEQDQEPSTADLLRAKRMARRERQEAQRPTRGRTPGISGSVPTSSQTPSSIPSSIPGSDQGELLSDQSHQFGRHSGVGPQQSQGSHTTFYPPYTQSTLASQYSRPNRSPPPSPLQPHNGQIRRSHFGESPPVRNKDRSQSPSRVVRHQLSQVYHSPAQDLNRRYH